MSYAENNFANENIIDALCEYIKINIKLFEKKKHKHNMKWKIFRRTFYRDFVLRILQYYCCNPLWNNNVILKKRETGF